MQLGLSLLIGLSHIGTDFKEHVLYSEMLADRTLCSEMITLEYVLSLGQI